MKTRCGNPKDKAYARYGGRGIIVCPAWVQSFPLFLTDMGERTEGMEIDRIDNDGPYCPFNCRWASRKQQMRNTSRTRMITLNGETLCLVDWAARMSISVSRVCNRLALGWSVERALTEPAHKR
jgi:hypothetical protein